MVDTNTKVKCVAALQTMTNREVFDNVFRPQYGDMWTFETFKRRMRDWRRKSFAEEEMLSAGTFPKFTAHDATVQVNADGRITQLWVKQQKDVLDWIGIKKFITEGMPKSDVVPSAVSGESMLEIPLFDMHFGIATLDTYIESLAELVGIIGEKQYEEINILFGQDVLHTNDMRGHTAKGTDIGKVDFKKSWEDACRFFRTIIDCALRHAPKVRLRYSKGNHDECAAWCLFKVLEAYYPQCEFDDGMEPRKCIFWKGCWIGFGHCEYTSKNSLLFQNFVLDFPQEFANAKVREIHSGHLHRESVDEGIFVRRLPSGVPTDEWSSNNGYTGAHKRFQIFEWMPERLKAIYYI